MTTVAEVNQGFEDKKMSIQLPYPEDWMVKNIQILEKKDSVRGIKVLLAVELIRDGKIIHDICYLEGEVERPEFQPSAPLETPQKSSHILPLRHRFDFNDDAEVLDYLKSAFAALLMDNGYQIEDHPEADLYGTFEERGFFTMLACRLDEEAGHQARKLIDLRKKYKHMHDYGLVVPAIQEPLGIPLSVQESWVMANVDVLSNHRVGLYGVDNSDPNRVYPFTIYPQVRSMLNYFVATSQQWRAVRTQYLMSRGK
jgi:hypothetical protein